MKKSLIFGVFLVLFFSCTCSKNVVYIADKIARLKGVSIEEVAFVTSENAKRLFKI